jgi:hypothetical protein
VGLDDELDAYNVCLRSFRDAERDQWAHRVLCALASRYAGLRVELTVYAGADYAEGLDRALRLRRLRPRRSTDPALVGFDIANLHTPLAGLSVGRRLAWFKAQRPAEASPPSMGWPLPPAAPGGTLAGEARP